MNPRAAELLDAADTAEENGNLSDATWLRSLADALPPPRLKRHWTVLIVTPFEPERFFVQSQTKEMDHLVDIKPWSCSCCWALDYAKAGTRRLCAHQRRLKAWLDEKRS